MRPGPPQYFPDVSAMEQVAYSWALLSARWVFPYACPVRGCLASRLCHRGARSQEPALGPVFHLRVQAGASHMAVSRPAARLGDLCLFIYFNL